jgi:hypothetical protein
MEALKEFSFWAAVAFVLPGFFLVEARSFAARTRVALISKESVTAFVICTVIYNLVLWYFGFALQTKESISSLDSWFIAKAYVLWPLVIGVVWGLAERFFIVQWVLGHFGINAPLPVDSVWLEIFSRQSIGTYLLITLKDGTVFKTAVTDDSRFGSSGDSPDIYLGQTYRGKKWKPFDPPRGVYIRGSEIRTIEVGGPDE